MHFKEYGLVGSTEWVEDHDWLKDKAVTYINVDTAVSGPHFVIQASPSLNQLIYEVASLVQDPRTGGSVYDAWAELTNRTLTPSPKPYIGQLGSGSDFVPFLDHLGISSISLSFSGDYGVYHSNYDRFVFTPPTTSHGTIILTREIILKFPLDGKVW